MKRKIEPEKHCVTCDALLARKRYNGRLEDYQAFLRRKYCSLHCANTRLEHTPAWYRWKAEVLRKTECANYCEVCGATTNLHAHHIDGDITNNVCKNIQTLCGSCHAKRHHAIRRLGKIIPGKMECVA